MIINKYLKNIGIIFKSEVLRGENKGISNYLRNQGLVINYGFHILNTALIVISFMFVFGYEKTAQAFYPVIQYFDGIQLLIFNDKFNYLSEFMLIYIILTPTYLFAFMVLFYYDKKHKFKPFIDYEYAELRNRFHPISNIYFKGKYIPEIMTYSKFAIGLWFYYGFFGLLFKYLMISLIAIIFEIEPLNKLLLFTKDRNKQIILFDIEINNLLTNAVLFIIPMIIFIILLSVNFKYKSKLHFGN